MSWEVHGEERRTTAACARAVRSVQSAGQALPTERPCSKATFQYQRLPRTLEISPDTCKIHMLETTQEMGDIREELSEWRDGVFVGQETQGQ